MKRAVIFDFDGVLADSWSLHERCWRQAVDRYDGKIVDATFAKVLGLSSLETATTLIKEAGLSVSAKQLAETKDELWSERAAKELEAMPGAVEALKRLEPDFALAIASLRHRRDVTQALERFELASVPQVVVCVDDLKHGQDGDDLLKLVAKQLDLAPVKCVVVEDARNGVLAAKRVGMNAIAFDSNPKHDFDSSMADAQISSLDELVPELINQVIAG